MMRHLQIFGNSSSIGGGIRFRDECTVTFDSSSVINNSSNVGSSGSFDGGGVYVSGDVIMDFQDLIIQNNHANDRGGGLYLASAGTMNLERLLINNNTSNSGGGISVLNNGDVVPSIINCTIVNNIVLDNDDASAIDWTRGTITNSIIWGNQGGETVIPHPAQNYTDISYCNIDMDLIGGGAGNINANPRFCASETGDFTIANNSPCIGSGLDGANIGAFGAGAGYGWSKLACFDRWFR